MPLQNQFADLEPDYSKLFIQRPNEDEDAFPCNPTVFHPTQQKFEDELNHIQNPNKKETTEEKLNRASARAREILLNRHDIVQKTGDQVHRNNKRFFQAATIFGAIGATLAFPLVAIATPLVHYTNKAMTRKYHQRVDNALAAIDTCNDPSIGPDKKFEQYNVLVKTAYRMRTWENTKTVLGMVAKGLFAHVSEAVEGAILLKDIVSGVQKHTEKKRSCDTLLEAAVEMGDALGFNTNNEKKALGLIHPEGSSPVDKFRQKLSQI